MSTIRLTWQVVPGAVSYNIYHSQLPGLSIRFTPLLTNTTQLTYDHTALTPGQQHYYIVVAVGPNGELGPPSVELNFTS